MIDKSVRGNSFSSGGEVRGLDEVPRVMTEEVVDEMMSERSLFEDVVALVRSLHVVFRFAI